MGAILSSLLAPFKPLVTAIGLLRDMAKQFGELDARFNDDPGLPRKSPTQSFWLEKPPFPELADIQSAKLPEEADVVIIGSGISGAAVARSLFETGSSTPSVVVLEARQLCSGATGRNGGHIKASPHEVIHHLVEKLGMPGERAAAIVRFQLSHLKHLTELCQSDADLLANSECRTVESVDLIVEDKIFGQVKHMVALLKKWVPEYKMSIWSAAEAQTKFSAGPHVVGAVTYEAGALWPYRFVTTVWKHLLDAHAGKLSIETNTAAEAIETTDSAEYPYLVTTPRGTIRARHVVHATNAFASHLLPRLRRKVTGMRAHMSAQRPGPKFPDLDGKRSWSVIYNSGFDYITQRPSRTVQVENKKTREAGEVMTGGGFVRSADQGLNQIGIFDDTTTDFFTALHLHGVLPTVFGPHWGADAENGGRSDKALGSGHVSKLWSGIIGFSADMIPLVGRLEPNLTGRSLPAATATIDTTGEWISAVFQGEGMVWAWLSGTALGLMVAGLEQEDLPPAPGRPSGRVADWFPQEMRPTNDRLKKIDITKLADLLL